MEVWVLTRPPLGRGRNGDDDKNEVDMSVNHLAYLTLLNGFSKSSGSLQTPEKGREGGREGKYIGKYTNLVH